MSTSLSFLERAKLASAELKVLSKTAKKTESADARKLRLESQLDSRIARWEGTFESVLLIAKSDSNLAKRQRAARLLIKMARYIETGKFVVRSASVSNAEQKPRKNGKFIAIRHNGTLIGNFAVKLDAMNHARLYQHRNIEKSKKDFCWWTATDFDRDFDRLAKVGYTVQYH